MGECFLWIPATGEIILDIPPNDQTFATPREADPYSVVNGGPAVLTLGQKG
jgi:hypothetical protein